MRHNPQFTNKFEEKRFMNHILNDRYDQILVLWGVGSLFHLLKWYQHIDYYKGIVSVAACIEKYHQEKLLPKLKVSFV